MPKALDLKPGQKFRLANNSDSKFIYIVPTCPSENPVIVWNDYGSKHLSVSRDENYNLVSYTSRFSSNPEVILTDEKITI